mmetsp:Transcript_26499/g.30419  ORF Transcript_26499/g.30419 Transcript_26499/m.30419 type:complete len:412 (+) Transcript_26499:109-1344(+)
MEDSDMHKHDEDGQAVDNDGSGSESSGDFMFVTDQELAAMTGQDVEGEGEEEGDAPAPLETKEVPPTKIFESHTDSVYSVDWNPTDENIFVTGGGDDIAIIWSIDGTPLYKLEGHSDTVLEARYSKDGKFIATGSLDGTVKIWNSQDGVLRHTLEGPSEDINWISWHPKGPVIACGSVDKTIWMWNAVNGDFMQMFSGHEESVTVGGFTPDGKFIISAGGDRSLRVWNPKNGNCIQSVSGHGFHEEDITSMDFHHSKPLVLTGSVDGTTCLTNYSNGKLATRVGSHEGGVECAKLSLTHDLFATCGTDGKLVIYDSNTFHTRHNLDIEFELIKLQWHATEPLILVCGNYGPRSHVSVWDARQGTVLMMFNGHEDMVMDFATNKTFTKMLTGSDDSKARLFELPDTEGISSA